MSKKYLLLDGVRYDQALARLYQRDEELQIEPLYAGTPWQKLADLGPILLGPNQHSPLWQEVENEPEWRTAAAVLTSHAPMTQIADHLRQFNQVTDTQGNAYLLRYADPLIAWFWLNSFGTATAIQVLGPISQWHIVQPQPAWQTVDAGWHLFNGSDREASESPGNPFGEAQRQALDEAYRWQLKSRLYACLQANHPVALQRLPPSDVDDWLNDRLLTAEAWGLASERSQVIWCALSLTHGDDFVTATEGLYQHWLSHHQTAAFTPDQRLQQYYQTTVEPEGLLT